MKLIDHKLFIEFAEMLACGVPQRTLESWKEPVKVPDPEKKSRKLIDFQLMADKYKALVNYKFGDPYEYVSKSPIKALIKKDFEAEKFFMQYRFDNGNSLPANYVEQYTTAASWLNMIISALADKVRIKKQFNLTIDQFWDTAIELITKGNVDLPTSKKRLRMRVNEYQQDRYKVLISGKFANKNRNLVADEVSESVLEEMIANHQQHDDVVIQMAYNTWAVANGKDIIKSYQTIGNYRRSLNHIVCQQREGNAAWYNTYGKSIKRERAAGPLYLVESDDNDLDKYFMDGKNPYYRFKLVVVTDAGFNDYPLGWACGDEQTIELVKAAYLDAMHHIKDLTGNWYMPHQIKTDRWGIDQKLTTELGRYYKSIDPDFFPAAAKGPRGKYIEQSFGKRWHKYLKLDELDNYAGTNVTSRGRVNRDMLLLNKKNFPKKEEGVYHIQDFINRVRMHEVSPGVTLQQQWKDAFASNKLSQQKQVSREQMLYTFGTRHIVPSASNPVFPNVITKDGIILQIDGKKYTYDIPEMHYLHNIGRQVQVIYDPQDMSTALVHDGGNLRFVSEEMALCANNRLETTPDKEKLFWSKMHQKDNHMKMVAARVEDRRRILKDQGINTNKLLAGVSQAQSLLQAGVMDKSLKQLAEHTYQQEQLMTNDKEWQDIQDERIANSTDLDFYLND